MKTPIHRSSLLIQLIVVCLGMTPSAVFAQNGAPSDAFGSPEGGIKPAPRPKKVPPKPATKAPEAAKPGGPAAPTPTAKFGAWVVFCEPKKTPTDPANCIALISVARDKADPRKIAIMGITKRDNALQFFTQTPTTVELKPGIEIQYEGRAPRHFDYSSCEPALCTVTAPLDDALADEIAATPTVTVSWTGLAIGGVKVVFGTEGAREAINFVKAQ